MGGTTNGVNNNFNNRTGQTNDLNDAVLRNRTENTAQPTGANDGANSSGNILQNFYERQGIDFTRQQLRLQNDQPQQQDNKEINGITAATPFPKQIERDETQESVLRRTFEEYAFKAGISNARPSADEKSPAELFVEERMASNKEENKGEYRIFNSKTGVAYTDAEWKEFQQSGGIIMKPTAQDIESLKGFKAESDFNDGRRAAQQVLQAMEAGDGISAARLLGFSNPSGDLARALDRVQMSSGNADFQEGFVKTLGAEKFLKLETMLADNPGYNRLLRNSLSSAAANEITYADDIPHEPSIGAQIAKSASADALARLAGDANVPMSKEFLVEAGKRITTYGVGWETSRRTTEAGGFAYATADDLVNPNSRIVFEAISRSPDASTELLQNPDFIRNGLRMRNATVPNPDGNNSSNGNLNAFAKIITAGTSVAARESNPQAVEKAITNLAQTLSRSDSYQAVSSLETARQTTRLFAPKAPVTEDVSLALAELYRNNAPTFSRALSSRENPNGFDRSDVIAVFTAINQSERAKQSATATNKAEFERLLREFPNDPSAIANAGSVVGVFSDTVARSEIAQGETDDKIQERRTQVITSIIGGFGNTPTSALGLKDPFAIVIATTTNIAANAVTDAAKTEGANQARTKANQTYDQMLFQNRTALLSVYESDAFAVVSGQKQATPQQLNEARSFISALQAYNSELPANAKILDGSGRLIQPAQANLDQLTQMDNLTAGQEVEFSQNRQKTKEAAILIHTRIDPTAHRLQSEVTFTFRAQ